MFVQDLLLLCVVAAYSGRYRRTGWAAMPQLLSNFWAKSTGELSVAVAAMGLSGCTTRLYTTYLEVGDLGIRLMSLLNWLLSVMLTAQFRLYRRPGKSK